MNLNPKVISPENQATFIAVTFVLGLLSLAFNFFNYRQINVMAVGVAALEIKDAREENTSAKKDTDAMAAFENRLKELESKQAASAVVMAPPAPTPP